MTRLTTFLLGLSLLLSCATGAAAIVPGSNVGVRIDFLETADGTWAFVRVQSHYHFQVMGDVTILKNGEFLKVDPVATMDDALVTAFLGPNGRDYAVCATFEGETFLGGDNYRATEARACKFRSAAMPLRQPPHGGKALLPRSTALDGPRPGRR
jgi:hypothetical protein